MLKPCHRRVFQKPNIIAEQPKKESAKEWWTYFIKNFLRHGENVDFQKNYLTSLENDCRWCAIRYHSSNSRNSFSNLLKGYEVFRILPHGSKLAHIDPSRPENNIYHLSNYVFIRNDISKKYK